MRTAITLVVALAAALAGSAGQAATRAATGCGTARAEARNGNQLFVPGAGPSCLLGAFSSRCRAAVFVVKTRGVDTSGLLSFRVLQTPRCHVLVEGRSRVFGFDRTTRWTERCTRLARRAEGVAVLGCDGRAGNYLLSPTWAPDVPGGRIR